MNVRLIDGEPGGVSIRGNDTNFHAYSINVYTSGISELVVFLCAEAGFGQNDQYKVVKLYASVKFLIPIETNCKLFSNIP